MPFPNKITISYHSSKSGTQMCAVYIKKRDSLVFMDFCRVFDDVQLFNRLTDHLYTIDRHTYQADGSYAIKKFFCDSQSPNGLIECAKSGNTFVVSIQFRPS